MALPKKKTKTVMVSMRITPETADLWEKLAEHLGISKVSAFEMAVRKMARAEGVVEIIPGNDGA